MNKKPDIIRKVGAASLCKETHCMGNPKEVITATTFIGEICKDCMAVCWYEQKSLKEPSKAKLIAMARQKKIAEDREKLENGQETESEINSAKQYKSSGPKSKNNKETNIFRKPKPKRIQTNLFEEHGDEIKLPKKVEEKILRLGIEKDKKEKILKNKNK